MSSTGETTTATTQAPPSGGSQSRALLSNIDYDRFRDCIHCGLCTAVCPTYLETGDENNSPRGRIYLMRGMSEGRLDLTPNVRKHLDLCLDCRSCESACPSGVDYGRLIEPFRVGMKQAEANAEIPRAENWFDRLILFQFFPYAKRLRLGLAPVRWLQTLRIDRLVERLGLLYLVPKRLRRMYRLLPRMETPTPPLPERLPAWGTQRARVGLLTGCVADAMFRKIHWATARVLQANGCEVFIPKSQTCCGAIHYHNGKGKETMQLAAANLQAFDWENLDAVITNVAGCGAMLKDYPHIGEELEIPGAPPVEQLTRFSDKVRDISEFLAELGPIQPTGEVKLRAVYHDACHLAHAQQVRRQPRDLLQLVPGLELLPFGESDMCCGAAGTYNLTETEMSDRLAERKLRNILASGAEVVISGNAGCTLQLMTTLKQAGQSQRVLHPMEILDESYLRGRFDADQS